MKKNINKIIFFILFLVVFTTKLSYAQNGDTPNSAFDTGMYISIDMGFFLPVFTINIRVNFRMTKDFSWGIGLNYFLMAGYSINVEGFIKFSIINTERWETPISIGILTGFAEEVSFGTKPKNFFGIGTHLQINPFTIKTENYGISLLLTGMQIISNFSSFAFTLYFGNGFRYYL